MIQYLSERWLTTIYGLIMICGTICSAACAVAWNHWKFVLDTCTIDVTCGCILNARSTYRYFTGGHVSHCHWAVYGLLPAIAVALVFFLYHGYRVCINNKGKPLESYEETVVTSRSREHISMVTRVPDKSGLDRGQNDEEALHLCWPPAAAICTLVFLHTLVYASMLTAGYYKSCYEYRSELVKILGAAGNQVAVIQSRLSCTSIFDFMDYLQPDVRDRHRGDFINTAAALQSALVTSWISVFAWLLALYLNVGQARRTRALRQ